jgi:hypothetical protein
MTHPARTSCTQRGTLPGTREKCISERLTVWRVRPWVDRLMATGWPGGRAVDVLLGLTYSNFKLSDLRIQHWLHGSYKQGTTGHPRRLQSVQPIGARYTLKLQREHKIQRRVQPAMYPSLVSLKSLVLCVCVLNYWWSLYARAVTNGAASLLDATSGAHWTDHLTWQHTKYSRSQCSTKNPVTRRKCISVQLLTEWKSKYLNVWYGYHEKYKSHIHRRWIWRWWFPGVQ